MAALYRKYRPQSFAEVVGQKHIVQTLQNAIANKTPAHAYLFTGTRGVGKTTLARLFAKALNCQKGKNGEACLKCDICLAVAANTFLDLVEIDAASNTGVENVRELIEHVKFQPSLGAYKVFIIDEVHMLSKQAFNALLKTLEEPPAHVIFILATTEAAKVPITIVSRTQRFDFNALTLSEISAQLQYILKTEKQSLPEDVIALIAQQADGSLRDAISLLDKVLALGASLSSDDAQVLLGVTDFNTHLTIFKTISTGDAAGIPVLFDQLSAKGIDFLVLNRDYLEFLRKALVAKISGADAVSGLNTMQLEELELAVTQTPAAYLIRMIRYFLKAFKDAGNAPSSDLPMLLASIECALTQVSTNTLPASASNQSAPPMPIIKPNVATITLEEVKPEVVMVSEISSVEEPLSEEVVDQNLTLDEVQVFWPKVIEKIRSINSPLATLVKNSPMISVEKGHISLQVKYRFHKEHLESSKHYALLTAIIEEVCGKKAGLKIIVNTEVEQVVTPVEALGNVLQVFGGELVE